ncbi:hypothetical protein [Burkholderia anthina]|uniref:hypothetical protein n=1 Tax=Burkholderia anthina TaxID=179879 RepID=UPI00158E8797|nr:hypothetical protein [Burkholderia anthina]
MLFQFDLFGPGAVVDELRTRDAGREAKNKAAGGSSWRVSDHACRHCFGRILERRSRGEVVEVRCAECGAREDGPVESLCCCGVHAGDLGHPLECFRNPDVTRENPHEILVRERRVAVVESEKLPARPVKLPGY